MKKITNAVELGESINDAGREFKKWFTEFTLVYSPLLIVAGLILTGIDLFLNLGIGNSLWFKLPWSIAQLFAVDGLWFAVWNRILTDEYKWQTGLYHFIIILLGLALTGIAITMNFIIFTQDYMGLKDSVAAMQFIGLPVSLFLLIRSVLLMLTATFAIVLDKVMRSKVRSSRKPVSKPEKFNDVPGNIPNVPAASTTVIPIDGPNELTKLPEKAESTSGSKRDAIKSTIEQFRDEGTKFTYPMVAERSGAALQTVKAYAPGIKKELGIN